MAARPSKAIHRPREIAVIESIADTLDAVNRLSDRSDTFNSFRGHASIRWGAIPSLFRSSTRVKNSEYMIVRDIVSRYPNNFLNDRTMFDRLVRMQHFGLPTRLLDVTSNPLVALYFAVSDAADEDGSVIVFKVSSDRKKYYDSDSVSCVCNLANLKSSEKETLETTSASTISEFHRLHAADRLFQFIREEKPHFNPRIRKEDLFKPYYVVAKRNNARIVAQSGAFLTFGLRWEDEKAFSGEITSYALRIPLASKPAIKRELATIGIDAGALFPEIDRAAKQIVEDYA